MARHRTRRAGGAQRPGEREVTSRRPAHERTGEGEMGQVTRRGLLRAGAGIAAGHGAGGRAAATASSPWPRARRGSRPDRRALGPVPDLRDGKVRLHLPDGFQLPLVPRHRGAASRWTTARRCPAATTGWPRSTAATGTSCSCATTRSTARCRPRSGRARRTTPGRAAARRRSSVTRFGEVVKRVHEPQRHADELLRRAHAVGQLGHVRGDRQRPRRRRRLHGRLERRR